ncbi:LysR family transcriptional regulator [Bacillus sp. JJ1566]|uniref:LysR family transcriptional regulator n=1 Tax=Bacillus sp. JJ1566 TaxID=3122961 RepID=UPI002FFEC05C
MDLLQLRYFQKVAKLQHLSQAAQELYITQPALSQTIARLEKDIGVPLFDRQGRQISLNEYGKVFLNKVEVALNALEEGRREIVDMAGLERGTVSIDTTFLPYFSDVINSFRCSYPDVHFRISQVSTLEKKEQLLENGEIDFSISCKPIERKGIRNLPIQTEEILLAVPLSHRLANQQNTTLSEIANEPFIHFKKGHSFRETTDELCEKAGFTPNVVYEVDESKTIKELVNSGLGVAFWLETLLERENLFHPLYIQEPVCNRTYYLSWSEKRYLSLAARTFQDLLIQHYKNL